MQSVLNKKDFSSSDMPFKMGCCLSVNVYLLLQGLGLVCRVFFPIPIKLKTHLVLKH